MSEAERWVRASVLAAMTSRDALHLVDARGTVRRLAGDTASLAEVLLAFCETVPRSRAEMRAHVEELSGAPLGPSNVLDELVDVLLAAGALVRPDVTATRTHARIVLGLGGAVAAAHAPMLVQALIGRGLEVRVIATERALRFVARDALEALTHAPVRSSMWPGELEPELRVPHVELATWADVVVVWPATASLISRIATGDCSELVGAVAITTRAPVLVAPSMNDAMLDAASVARNLETLRADGLHVVPSALAHEVAEAPDRRTPARGGAPDPMTLARLVEALARTTIPAEPEDAAAWEGFHRRVPEVEQAWTTDTADPAVMRLLEAHGAPGGALWDVGTGHGAIAIAAAERGFHVVATDVSETALARARARGGTAPIVWLADDAMRSGLAGAMDVIVDRGTLHTLPPAQRASYVSGLTTRTRPGSIVILTVHTPPGDPRVRSYPMSAGELAALFGDRFETVATQAGAFAGRLSPAPACVTLVLRRR